MLKVCIFASQGFTIYYAPLKAADRKPMASEGEGVYGISVMWYVQNIKIKVLIDSDKHLLPTVFVYMFNACLFEQDLFLTPLHNTTW